MRKYPNKLSETTLIEKILNIDSQFLDNDSIRINTLNILWTTFENCEVFEKEKYNFDSIYPLIIEWLCSDNLDIFVKACPLVQNLASWMLNLVEEVSFIEII